MLSSLLLGNIRILSCSFFLFLVVLSNFLIVLVVKEKFKVKIGLVIPTGAPTTLADKMIQTPLLVAFKTIKILSMQSKAVTYLLSFFTASFLLINLLMISLSRNFFLS